MGLSELATLPVIKQENPVVLYESLTMYAVTVRDHRQYSPNRPNNKYQLTTPKGFVPFITWLGWTSKW